MQFVFGMLLLALVVILLGIVVVALLLAVALGLGWVMVQFLPFSLFESTLLALIATAFVVNLAVRFLRSLTAGPDLSSPEDMAFVTDEGIPTGRFFNDDEDKTYEAWFRYEIANHIYEDLDRMELDTVLGKPQQKELAIRLTDIAVDLLRNRTQHKQSRRVAVTVAQMKAQMGKMGQQPYDDDILETAVGAINTRLAYDEDLVDIVLDKSWDEIDPDL